MKMFFILLLLVSLVQSLGLSENFGQEKEFRKFIITDQEKFYIDLNDHYRGHFLNFTVQSPNDSSMINGTVKITPPVQLK